MKLLTCLLLFLLAGCQFVVPSSDQVNKQATPPAMKSFEYSAECPHVCWLGINPGVTTAENAKALLADSLQINQAFLQVSKNEIFAVWLAGENNTYPSNIDVQISAGIVQSISIGAMPFTMNDFINLLGEPTEINIRLMHAADSIYVEYEVYYSKQRIDIQVSPASRSGPEPTDPISGLWLNTNLSG